MRLITDDMVGRGVDGFQSLLSVFIACAVGGTSPLQTKEAFLPNYTNISIAAEMILDEVTPSGSVLQFPLLLATT